MNHDDNKEHDVFNHVIGCSNLARQARIMVKYPMSITMINNIKKTDINYGIIK